MDDKKFLLLAGVCDVKSIGLGTSNVWRNIASESMHLMQDLNSGLLE